MMHSTPHGKRLEVWATCDECGRETMHLRLDNPDMHRHRTASATRQHKAFFAAGIADLLQREGYTRHGTDRHVCAGCGGKVEGAEQLELGGLGR